LNGDMGLDWFELGLYMLPSMPLDHPAKADDPLPVFMEDVAIHIVQLADKDLNGMASATELSLLFPIWGPKFGMVSIVG
jgi:hypothetical protein